jgi:hypothetical protein
MEDGGWGMQTWIERKKKKKQAGDERKNAEETQTRQNIIYQYTT